MKSVFLAGYLLVAACAAKVEIKEDLPSVINNSNSVYRVSAEDSVGNGLLTGSAVAYRQDKLGDTYKIYFLTAKHITDVPLPGVKFFIQFNFIGRFRSYETKDELGKIECTPERSSDNYDVSILSCISSIPIEIVQVSTSKIIPFTEVYCVGFPLGRGIHITEGVTSYSDNGGMASSAPVCPGFSGGPVFDKHSGKLIGIITAVAAIATNIGGGLIINNGFFWDMSYFVPLERVSEIL